jgi:hypothetical protein
VIVFLILNEIIEKENMAEIDEAISFVRFFRLPVIGRNIQVIESALMVHFKVLLDVVF